MTITEMIAAVRRDIRQHSPITVSDTQITASISLGADVIWEALVKADESIGRERVSISSDTNVFAIPSNVFRIDTVWDMNTTAKTITDATNASPIVVTSATHGFSDGDILFVHGVLGNTAANGTWQMDAVDANSFKLYGSTGNAAYTSGGKVFKETTTFKKLRKIKPREATGRHRYEYFIRGDEIVVDYTSFSNDIIIDFVRTAENTYSDIPARYHMGLVSYAVMELAQPVSQQDANYEDISQMILYHSKRFENIITNIASLYDQDASPIEFLDDAYWDQLY